MKRFRDENGKLTMSLQKIRRETKAEGNEYFQVGGIYLNAEDAEEYVLIEKDDCLVHFQSFGTRNLFIPADSLGTFLPDVASHGMELTRVE